MLTLGQKEHIIALREIPPTPSPGAAYKGDEKMFAFIAENLGTILVSGALLVIVGLVVASIVKKKKRGGTSCGCGCDGCPSASSCHMK